MKGHYVEDISAGRNTDAGLHRFSDALADHGLKVVVVAVVRVPVALVAGVGGEVHRERCCACDRDGVALGGKLRVLAFRKGSQHDGVVAVALAVVVIGVAGHQQRVGPLGDGLRRAAAVERDAAGKRAGLRRREPGRDDLVRVAGEILAGVCDAVKASVPF